MANTYVSGGPFANFIETHYREGVNPIIGLRTISMKEKGSSLNERQKELVKNFLNNMANDIGETFQRTDIPPVVMGAYEALLEKELLEADDKANLAILKSNSLYVAPGAHFNRAPFDGVIESFKTLRRSAHPEEYVIGTTLDPTIQLNTISRSITSNDTQKQFVKDLLNVMVANNGRFAIPNEVMKAYIRLESKGFLDEEDVKNLATLRAGGAAGGAGSGRRRRRSRRQRRNRRGSRKQRSRR